MKIMIVCGGTGGHIFPAISVAQELKKRGYTDIVFVIDKNPKAKEFVSNAGFSSATLDVPRMPYGFSIRWPSFAIRLFISRLKAADILRGFNPDVAVGFGAYISWPVISAAKAMGKKTVIHEQNATMGRANRLLIGKADRVCFSFDNILLGKDEKYVLTGNPIRSSLLKDLTTLTRHSALSHLGLSLHKKTILVLGGSKGASALNSLLTGLAYILSEKEKDSIQIMHITGDRDLEDVSRHYAAGYIEHWISGFYERMGILYKGADMVVCRAGATTIAELCIFGLPAIFIPYPSAGSHQIDNALILASTGGAVMLQQKDATPEELKKYIFEIINDENKREKMSAAMCSFAKSTAAARLTDIIERL